MIYRDYLKDKNQNSIKFKEAEGSSPLAFSHSKGRDLKNYQIYGNSTQKTTGKNLISSLPYYYPTPDDNYSVEVEYWTIFAACDEDGTSKATLENENDYIDIPEKYENLFKMALMPLAMVYAIASETDENHSGYKRQYDEAYKNLIEFSRGIDIEKRIGWR